MRKLLRSIARSKMQQAGIRHMNKRISVKNPITGISAENKSYFALHWREYI